MDNYKPGPPFDPKRDLDVINFVKFILNKNSHVLKSDTFWFIPGGIRKTSHNEILNIVQQINRETVVITLNGTHKRVSFYRK